VRAIVALVSGQRMQNVILRFLHSNRLPLRMNVFGNPVDPATGGSGLIIDDGFQPSLSFLCYQPERTLPGPVNITPDGTPICPAGYPTRYYGRDLAKIRLKWRCPMIYGSKKDRVRINCQTPLLQ